MRLVCLSLMLANLVLLAYFVSRPDVAKVKPVSERVRSDLLLLSEAPDLSSVAEPLTVAADPVAPVGPPVQDEVVVPVKSEPILPAKLMCSMMGPFDEVSRAKRMMDALVTLGLEPQMYTETIKVESGYWVILPPAASREKAREILNELKSKKIDSFIIREGELSNAISLGVYSKRDRAQVMVGQMAKRGYAVDISPILRDKRQYWAVLSSVDVQKASEEQLDLLLSGNDLIKKRQNSCEGLALSFNIQ